MDKISVIVPVYNGMEYLEKTINNILNSRYSNLEVILINDGSTDDSYIQCLKLCEKDSRIILINQSNKGIAETRNVGLLRATGEWICFCDQDDLVNIDMYKIMEERGRIDNSDLVLCGTGKLIDNRVIELERFQDSVFERTEIIRCLMYNILFSGYQISQIDDYLNENLIIGNYIWKCMVRRKMILNNSISFKRFINFEDDRTFLLELLAYATKVSTVKECLYYWRTNYNSETYRRRYIQNLEEKLQRYRNYEKKIFIQAGFQEDIINLYFEIEQCNNYVLYLENENGEPNTRCLNEKIKFLKKVIYKKDFKNNIKQCKNLKSTAFKRKIMLTLLEYRCLRMAYFFPIFYRRIKKVGLRYSAWAKLERKETWKYDSQ